jgi:hypothetical protein
LETLNLFFIGGIIYSFASVYMQNFVVPN